jgi:hypothetical protein
MTVRSRPSEKLGTHSTRLRIEGILPEGESCHHASLRVLRRADRLTHRGGAYRRLLGVLATPVAAGHTNDVAALSQASRVRRGKRDNLSRIRPRWCVGGGALPRAPWERDRRAGGSDGGVGPTRSEEPAGPGQANGFGLP